MTDDAELLRQYKEYGSEDAFSELVRRHLPVVYSAALRQVAGDRALAKDVAQTVFIDLARKAASLSSREFLAGWLYTSTRFAAAKAVRAERRRHNRERIAASMHEHLVDPHQEAACSEIGPALDDAMAALTSEDRNAVLLRFFQRKDLKCVGAALGAKMRLGCASTALWRNCTPIWLAAA
jgi:RNA polymerase sigma factor (sigma-70 family)